MKAIAAGAALFGAAVGGFIYLNTHGSEYSWMVAGMLYVLALFLVQFIQRNNSLQVSVRFNIVAAAVVTLLAHVDTLILHRGVFKDIDRFGNGLGYRVLVLVLGVGLPTVIVGSFFSFAIGRFVRYSRAK